MNSRNLMLTALLLLGTGMFAAAADADKAPEPGQLASSASIAALSATSLSASPAVANSVSVTPVDSIADVKDRHDRIMNRLWVTSMMSAVAGTSLDAASSWGKLESNSMLASSSGTFGAKGLSIKLSIAAAVIVPQICLRKHKELRTAFVIGNFADATVFAAAAIHNLGIHSSASN